MKSTGENCNLMPLIAKHLKLSLMNGARCQAVSYSLSLRATLLAAIVLTGVSVVAETKPNIVLIMVDDMAYNELGVTGQLERASNGQAAIETPNLDMLAQQGLILEQYYATPICASSRASILTGFHNGHSSIDRNGGNNGGNALRDIDLTIAENLKSVGYTTGQFGKWGVGGYATNADPGIINNAVITHLLATPASQGFDEFYGYLHQVHAHDYYVDFLWEHDTDNSGDPGGMQLSPTSDLDYSHDLIAARSLDFISNHADSSGANPFFLYAPYTIPHGDYNPPNDSIRQSFLSAGYSAAQADYAAMMKRLDNTIGDIVSRLKDPNQDGNQVDSVYHDTVILFHSDNGGNNNKNVLFDGDGELRGQKGSVYEGGIKSPFIAHWNGTIAPGQVNSTRIAGLDDIFATLSDLAGADRPLGLDGVSIANLFSGGEAEKRNIFIFEGNETNWAIRMDGWKLVNGNQLYHLPTDPSEENNLSAANPAITNLMYQIALDEGVLSDAGPGAAQTTHIIQYKTWKPLAASTDWNSANNWEGGTEFNTRGAPANNFHSGPANNWIANIDNTTANPVDIVASVDSEVVALEIKGSISEVKLTIQDGAALMARNGVRIGDGGRIEINNGELQTLRDIQIQPGGTLTGNGSISTSYDTSGTPFDLKADVVNKGTLAIAPSIGGTVQIELVSNGGFEQGIQSDGDPDYRFTELDSWTTDGLNTLDAAKPNNSVSGTYRGLVASRVDGLHNAVQNTNYLIEEGDEITLSFSHRGFLDWETGVDTLVASLFYLDDFGTRQILDFISVLPSSSEWNLASLQTTFINEVNAIGRELWVSFDPQSGNELLSNEFASIDEVSITVPGVTPDAPAILTVDGDFHQKASGKLQIDIIENSEQIGIGFDRLTVAGKSILGGTLEIQLGNEYQPQLGDSFVVLQSGEIEGTFSEVILPALPGGLQLAVAYSQTEVQINVTGVLGDYNHDGIVDAADYVVWRDTLGQVGNNQAADGNQNGIVDQADYDIWSSNYGNTFSLTSVISFAVPEPSTANLVLITGGLFLIPNRHSLSIGG